MLKRPSFDPKHARLPLLSSAGGLAIALSAPPAQGQVVDLSDLDGSNGFVLNGIDR